MAETCHFSIRLYELQREVSSLVSHLLCYTTTFIILTSIIFISHNRFVVNYHTNEIVGIAEDAFSLNVIRDELQELQKASKTDEQLLQETDDSSNSLPQQARHFLVFIATTWSEKLSQEFLVARYGKKSIESDFLVDAVRSIIVDLGLYGFIVDTITGDGASENRKVFKMLATFSARQVFFELNGERIWPEDYLDGLPLDF